MNVVVEGGVGGMLGDLGGRVVLAYSPLGTWTFELFGGLRGDLCECCRWGWVWGWFGSRSGPHT